MGVKMFLKQRLVGVVMVLVLAASVPATAAEPLEAYTVIIKDHVFSPAEVTVPAGKKVRLIVENQDSTPEEFESYDLNREEIVSANGSITVFIGPLKKGEYKFFGDFNQDKAHGIIIAQ
jgi:plastocyanin